MPVAIFTIPGSPSGACINEARRAGASRSGTPHTYKTGKAKAWSGTAALVVRSEWRAGPLDGGVDVEITTYWPQQRRKGPAAGFPKGDVDATAKAVLDVLQAAGVVHDDAQVRRLLLLSEHDPKRPRIKVRVIWNAEDGGEVEPA